MEICNINLNKIKKFNFKRKDNESTPEKDSIKFVINGYEYEFQVMSFNNEIKRYEVLKSKIT